MDAVRSGHSRIVVYGGGDSLWCKKVKPVDAVCSGIVVYGGGDIVFGVKRSNQWMQWTQSHSGHSTQWTQWMQYAVHAVHSGIVVYGGGDIVFDTKKVKPVDAVHSGSSMQWVQCNSGIWWWGHCL